jgi:hypothetical protein
METWLMADAGIAALAKKKTHKQFSIVICRSWQLK